MSAVKIVVVDCEKAGLIGGPFAVLVIEGTKQIASRSGIQTREAAETAAEDFGEVYMHTCTCCGEVCESGEDCCTDNFPEPGDLREWA